jgi:hypothetical protein
MAASDGIVYMFEDARLDDLLWDTARNEWAALPREGGGAAGETALPAGARVLRERLESAFRSWDVLACFCSGCGRLEIRDRTRRLTIGYCEEVRDPRAAGRRARWLLYKGQRAEETRYWSCPYCAATNEKHYGLCYKCVRDPESFERFA